MRPPLKPAKEKRRDSGEIRALVKFRDGVVFFVIDNLGNGGRKKKELTDEEKAQILAMREEGKNVNIIARELHISNRIISEFVKNN